MIRIHCVICTLALAAFPLLAPGAEPAGYLQKFMDDATLRWPNNHTLTIVCHGHSIPAGYARAGEVKTFDAYPHLMHVELNRLFPYAVINVIVTAIGGEQAESGAARFDKDALSLNPDVLTIDYALNDRHIGVARAEKAWRSMIEKALAKNVKVLLLTPIPDHLVDLKNPDDPLFQHARMVRALASEYNVGLVDPLPVFEKAYRDGVKPGEIMSQNNHPNRKGHQMINCELMKWFPKGAVRASGTK